MCFGSYHKNMHLKNEKHSNEKKNGEENKNRNVREKKNPLLFQLLNMQREM